MREFDGVAGKVVEYLPKLGRIDLEFGNVLMTIAMDFDVFLACVNQHVSEHRQCLPAFDNTDHLLQRFQKVFALN